MATTTVRLPPELKSEADAFAVSLGISLNALMAVALRDYIDARSRTRRFAMPLPDSEPAPVACVAPPPQATDRVAVRSYRPPKSRSDPCPCGARNVDGNPIRYKHCHGKLVP
jgi:hypothetical protein